MSNNLQEITVIGNMVDDPELRYTTSGVAVANFTVAKNPRFYDSSTGEWKNGDPLFFRCNVWREQAENVAASDLRKGTRVVVTGNLQARTYETREGETRTVWELSVDEVGPSLRFSIAKMEAGIEQKGEEPEETPAKKTVAPKPSSLAAKRRR